MEFVYRSLCLGSILSGNTVVVYVLINSKEVQKLIYRLTPTNASEVGCGESAKELLQEGLVVGRSAKEILMPYVA